MPEPALRTVRIATRESRLALWQANHVADRLRETTPNLDVDLVPVSTIGDRDRTGPLAQFGGEGVFTREVQRAVLGGAADIAVHSLKDLPTEPVEGLALAGVPPREARFDALLLPEGHTGDIDSLPSGARIGTGSPRRCAQLLRYRDDLVMLDIRGNVETRLKKLDAGEFDAIILAEAGLRRLELQPRISRILAPPLMYPAVGQAALGIECRVDDLDVIGMLERITDPETRWEVLAERACLATLRAGCHAPVGVLSSVVRGSLEFEAVVYSPDGRQRFHAAVAGHPEEAVRLGTAAAEAIIAQGAAAVLASRTIQGPDAT